MNDDFDSQNSLFRMTNAHFDILAEALQLLAHRDTPQIKTMLRRKYKEAEDAIIELSKHVEPHHLRREGILNSGSTRLLDLMPTRDSKTLREVASFEIETQDFMFAAGPDFILKALDHFCIEADLISEVIPLCYDDPAWLPVLERIAVSPIVIDIAERLPIWHFTPADAGFRRSMSLYIEVAAPLLRRMIEACPEIGTSRGEAVVKHRVAEQGTKIKVLQQLRACGAEFDNSTQSFKEFDSNLTSHERVAIYQPCKTTAAHAARSWEDVAAFLEEDQKRCAS